MTDITQELLHLQENGYEYVMAQFALQEQKIKEKKHILNVHYAFLSLEKMVDNKDFINNGVAFILVSNYYDYDIGNIVDFTLLDKNHELVEKYNSKGNYTHCQGNTRKILSKLIFDNNFVNLEFKQGKAMQFALTKDDLANFKNMLLSDKLNAYLNHALLDTQLSEKPADNKKMKI